MVHAGESANGFQSLLAQRNLYAIQWKFSLYHNPKRKTLVLFREKSLNIAEKV